MVEEGKNMNGFTARKVNFDGTPGYMVKQYIDGKMVVEQFVSETAYKVFCDAIGISPIRTDLNQRFAPDNLYELEENVHAGIYNRQSNCGRNGHNAIDR